MRWIYDRHYHQCDFKHTQICYLHLYVTHTNYSYHYTIIQTFVFWKSVKGILSCSLSFKRVHYQCLPKSLCLCSKRLSLLCFKRIISCPYKSTIIFTLTQKTFTPACKMVLPNYLKMVGLFWPWILNYFYATESDTDGRQSIKIIYKLKVNIWQKSNGMKNRDKGVGQRASGYKNCTEHLTLKLNNV